MVFLLGTVIAAHHPPTSNSLCQVSYLKQEENVAGIGLILTFISKGMSRHPTSAWT